MPEVNAEERYAELQAGKERYLQENQQVREKIAKVLQKLSVESCWQKKSEAVEVAKRALVLENAQLKEHLWSVTRAYDEIRIKEFANRDKIAEVQELEHVRENLQRQIDRKQEAIINCKVKLACFKNIDKEAASVKADNKKLLKKYAKLVEVWEKLYGNLEDIENEIIETREVWRENAGLYEKIFTLENHITKKKALQTRLKSLKCEKKYLEKERKGLVKQASSLEKDGKKHLVDQLLKKQQILKDEILNQRHMSDQLQQQYGELYVQVYSLELLEFSNANKEQEIEEMVELKKEQRRDIRRHRMNLKRSPGAAQGRRKVWGVAGGVRSSRRSKKDQLRRWNTPPDWYLSSARPQTVWTAHSWRFEEQRGRLMCVDRANRRFRSAV
ncbi:hypothetical protein WMY93_031721 [Mugilogobius chulae]|uniref:Uncharacterized protein n=1 Tax=Mugilogobius chulae TaxID=88201 RepID=A0AAW0MHM8_9GOBI